MRLLQLLTATIRTKSRREREEKDTKYIIKATVVEYKIEYLDQQKGNERKRKESYYRLKEE